MMPCRTPWASWREALRAISAFHEKNDTAPSARGGASYLDASGRIQVYELVAQAQLFGPPGYRITSENLRVLRGARWELLKMGSPRSKSALLERVLQLYTEASRALFYDPVPSQAERQSLLLEQMQCLVEARVSGIPLTALHYRHPLQSPQLSEVAEDLPLVLLHELESAEAHAGQRPENENGGASGPSTATAVTAAAAEERERVAARLDCAVGLAASGYAESALRLCTADGFPYVIRQVARLRRDGWKQAWALADVVPVALLMASRGSPSGQDLAKAPEASQTQGVGPTAAQGGNAGWLNGVLDAAVRKYKATGDPSVKEWVCSLMRLWVQGPTPEAQEGNVIARTAAPVPLRMMETYLTVCPASFWREAVKMVLRYNATGCPFHGNEPKEGADAVAAHKVAIGRLMALLIVAEQPAEVLKLFYGSLFDVSTVPAAEKEKEKEKEAALWGPSNEFLSTADMQHPATYNHTMMAMAQLGYWRRAVAFYERLPAAYTNRHTHWTAVRMLIRPFFSAAPSPVTATGGREEVPDFVKEESMYKSCLAWLKRAWIGDDGEGDGTASASFADAESVFECVALWAASLNDWRTAVWLSNHAPRGCRYVRLIALASLLRSYGGAAAVRPIATSTLHQFLSLDPKRRAVVRREPSTHAGGAGKVSTDVDAERSFRVAQQLDALLGAHDASIKQVCLALAFVANSAAAAQLLGAESIAGAAGHEKGERGEVLRQEVAQAFATALGRRINGSQDGLDRAIAILMEQFFRLRQHQRHRARHGRAGVGEEERRERHYPSFERAKVLSEVVHLTEGIADNEDDGWRVLLQVLNQLGKSQGLSTARAAPAMVSAGMKPEVAIRFLDP